MTAHITPPLTPAWRKWLIENLQQGCSHASLTDFMLQTVLDNAVFLMPLETKAFQRAFLHGH